MYLIVISIKSFKGVSRVFQECFNEVFFAILFLHVSHRSYPSRRRACLDNNDNSNHEVTDKEDGDSIEGSDSSNGNIAEYVVPKKKTKKELTTPKLSWFEKM